MSKENKKVPETKPQQTKLKVPMDTKYISKLTLTLMGICLVVALLLGLVNHVTAPIIAAATAEKTAAAMAQVLEADEYSAVENFAANGAVTALYQAVEGGQQIGYVAEVTTNGFGGAINMVVGVDMEGKVTGVSVIKDTETANLGTKVTRNQSVLDRFIGLGGTITVNSGENRFDGVTGATVSSKAVTTGVNTALAAVAANQ